MLARLKANTYLDGFFKEFFFSTHECSYVLKVLLSLSRVEILIAVNQTTSGSATKFRQSVTTCKKLQET